MAFLPVIRYTHDNLRIGLAIDSGGEGVDVNGFPLDKRRVKIQERINNFNQHINRVLCSSMVHGESTGDGEEDVEMETEMEMERVDSPEQVELMLPSMLGREICIENGWEKMVEAEIELRVSQAEDYLEKLRLALGHKSAVYEQVTQELYLQMTIQPHIFHP
jgi:hypothetical protein